MSFAERNKVWLLPALGAGILAVVWMNYQSFKSAPAPVEPRAEAAATAQILAATTPPPTVPPSAPNAAADGLWADLRGLETPPPELNRAEVFLQQGGQALPQNARANAPVAALHPQQWSLLPEPYFPRQAAVTAVTPGRSLQVDFIIDTARGREAWFEGRAYHVGQSPDGSHQIKAIHERSVLLNGPSGELELSTLGLQGRARLAQPVPSDLPTPPAPAEQP